MPMKNPERREDLKDPSLLGPGHVNAFNCLWRKARTDYKLIIRVLSAAALPSSLVVEPGSTSGGPGSPDPGYRGDIDL